VQSKVVDLEVVLWVFFYVLIVELEKYFRDKFIYDMQKENNLGDIAMAGYSPLIPEPLRDKYKKEADIDKYLKNIERLRKRGLV